MKRVQIIVLIAATIFFSCKDQKEKEGSKIAQKEIVSKNNQNEVEIFPVKHATTVLKFNGKTIYIDPTGGKEAFESHSAPDMVFITDIHGDHMNLKTLNALDLSNTIVIAPKAVAEKLKTLEAKEVVIIDNGDIKEFDFLKVEAIPMYNLREEALKFHSKGRGNGYVFTLNNERIYFSGDTEDIPEMRALKNIDRAFVCMNLPYTMTVESAASAVLEFSPKKVYPYHYRGTNGMSDVSKFKSLVNAGNEKIEVVQLKWY